MKALFLALALGMAALPSKAATTTVYSTTTYGGVAAGQQGLITPAALPSIGAYYFNLVVTSTNSTAFTGLQVYMQQQGIAGGQYYTVQNSTFTSCSAACTQFVVPDIYLGGNVRPQWAITSGSATLTVTAIPASP